MHTYILPRMSTRLQRINIQSEITRIIEALRRLNHALEDIPRVDSAEEVLKGIEHRFNRTDSEKAISNINTDTNSDGDSIRIPSWSSDT